MKKLIILLLVAFTAAKSFAQYPIKQNMGSPSTQVTSRGGLATDSSFTFATSYSDTTAANRGFIDAIPGTMIRVGDNLYVRNALATKWNLLGSTSGGVNIYNSDGILTGARIVTGNGNDLTFDNVGNFTVNNNSSVFLGNTSSNRINISGGFSGSIAIKTQSLQFENIPSLGKTSKRVLVIDSLSGQLSSVQIDSVGGASGGGVRAIYAGVNLIKVNDSTLAADTTNGATKLATQGDITRAILSPAGNYGNLQINRNGQLAGTDSVKMDSAFKVTAPTYVYDSIKAINGIIHGSVNIGDTVTGTKVAIFWGNSVTAGYNLPSPTTQRFPALTAHNFGWLELNRGISGTRLTFNFSGDSSMINRLYLIPTYSSTYVAMFFDYGLNDDQAGVDTTTFKTAYARVIDTCVARGWPLNRIYLISPNYNTYSLTPHTDNFAIAIRTIAGTKGVNFIDDYTYTLTHGASALLQADSLHPNVQGADVIRQGISQFIKETFKRVGDLIVTGNTTLNGTVLIPSSSTLNSGIAAIDDTNTGFAINSGNSDQAAIFNGGVPSLALTRNFMQGDASWQYCWTTGSGGGFAGGPDAGIAKQGAAAVRVSNGSTGYGTMAASAFITHGTTSGDVTVQSATGTWTMTLPTSAGTSGYVLQTDGSGVTSWVAQSGGSGSGNNLYVRINKTLADSILWSPNDSTLVGKSIDIVSGDSSVTITKTKTDSTLKYDVRLRADTLALASFAGGGANAGDTTAFTTSTIYGSFFNSLSDTLVITNLRIGLQGTSPSVGVTVYWNDSLGVTAGATKLVNAGSTATNIYTGTSVTSFDNTKIPPGVWVWVQTTTVTTKPTYMTATLIGYKKRTQ